MTVGGALPAPAAEQRDIRVASGRLRVHLWGLQEIDRPTVVCVPGLTSNATAFDWLAAELLGVGHRVVAVDLRGRGASDCTPAGTYGWPAHAEDVSAIAAALGVESFVVIGHSMGAYVGMQLAGMEPARIRRLVLIDGAGLPEPASLVAIGRGLERLDRWHESEHAYLDAIRSVGIVSPWNAHWDRFYRYELVHRADGRVRSKTSLAAALEDVKYGRDHRQDHLWTGISCPALLLRASIPLQPEDGFVVSAADAERFVREVPDASAVDVEANHFGVMTASATYRAIKAFLSSSDDRCSTAAGRAREDSSTIDVRGAVASARRWPT